MANEHYTADDTYIAYAEEMALWRNGDAALAAAGVKGSDEFIEGRLMEPVGIADPSGRSHTYIPKWRTARYIPGTWTETYDLQTARLLYPAFGVCSTVENTPVGYNTHTMSLRISQTPKNHGRHLERENETAAESERIDMLGLCNLNYHAECSHYSPVATQTASWLVAYTKNTGCNDIARPTTFDAVEPFKWNHFTFPVFTYGGETIEADIMGWSFDIQNFCEVLVIDSTGYYTKGKMKYYQLLSTSLDIIPYGHNAFELCRTHLEDYATDLDLTVKCARDATNDYIQWAHDKLYAYPIEIEPCRYTNWQEAYRLVMHQLNTGSLVPSAVDAYDNDYYENP